MAHLILLILAGVCFGLAFFNVDVRGYVIGWLGFAFIVLDWLLATGSAGPVLSLVLLILAGVCFLLAFWNTTLRGYAPGWLGWLLIVIYWLLAAG